MKDFLKCTSYLVGLIMGIRALPFYVSLIVTDGIELRLFFIV